jgi:hypothetical protein
MGMFGFRRLREREAAAKAAASFSIQAEPTVTQEDSTNGDRPGSNTKRSRRKYVLDAE